ncbi:MULTISPECIES: bifunctional phosphoribosyl-AMP cyclohydrolase/phosphoribosyl-ATP diphosphatase HisIE [unclassified Peribacillus]|uniref:bifunctional phosphoribosyl-AMP cyclohydrolase/phosphoribosyl-ATP diphosphatase HisIE n=1 Tax=unclassified Peribacillus TaxID=2675266 RepID=UPI001911A0FA|nr:MULTISPECIES: bifunctional phosphoribosyl-AMP cyclohydrolase/phosphoribosyl-ATP diphosphatase HisIE [unclassified Peribacillus]MBK5443924.1 bifunctional phosphoribosyl-AMP cyclohydrolase/phosphoribosyl-ATP diphosphatase HisIE [Peribacillus sp. TH24]MBK5461357.1 bifunctional phosphoribosyl-AMP cyclohydrolase/phosphoribosyl-ATP diphosphatase HisIE [Peribacillus sp. TH27]MBK5485323.1 bifunctional phosphoribosyl-AMP cyclohydrolase/phosphoribosyl-ATP diphosphatase HisIE [Peribacillus sp. TH16]MBK
MNLETIRYDEKGLVPAIVQDAGTGEVLTLAYMNKESLQLSIEKGETVFFSRSRNELWHKGETSGNTQKITEMKYDCDQDAIVVRVVPAGPACHTGATSCFSETIYQNKEAQQAVQTNVTFLTELEKLIGKRKTEMPEGSYTTYLFDKGVDKILKKVGEEAAEVIIAAKNRDAEELSMESADLLYHLFVLLQEQELPFQAVLDVLKARHSDKDEPKENE